MRASRLGIDRLLASVKAARPPAQPIGLTLLADRTASASVQLGRDGTAYVDPYYADATPYYGGGVGGYYPGSYAGNSSGYSYAAPSYYGAPQPGNYSTGYAPTGY